MKKLIFLFLLCLSTNVFSAQIVATVNDMPISSFDAEARAKLIAIQNSTPITDAKKKEYVEQALKALIDDKVKIIEATKQQFAISNKDIQNAIYHLEAQNGLKKGSMESMLKKNKIPLSILQEQIKADLLWLQVIQKNKSAIPEATQTEINKRINKIRKELQTEGFYVAEILVKDKKTAEQIYTELHKGKAFQELAEKNSISPSAKKGGEVGWIENNHYPTKVMMMLTQMSSGDVTAPIKTEKGYLIVLILERKHAIKTDTIPIWELAQMALQQNKTAALGDKINSLNSCETFMDFAKTFAIEKSAKSGMIAPDQLPQELKNILNDKPTNQVIGPIQTQNSDLFFMKCKITQKKIIPDKREIKMQIEGEEMEKLSEKLLKNAKRFVVIEKK